jgi:hypothetical protein
VKEKNICLNAKKKIFFQKPKGLRFFSIFFLSVFQILNFLSKNAGMKLSLDKLNHPMHILEKYHKKFFYQGLTKEINAAYFPFFTVLAGHFIRKT